MSTSPRTVKVSSPKSAASSGKSAAKDAVSPSFTITELAAEFDVTPRAIRFYEDMGLLEPARSGRNRVYTSRDRTRLKLTLRGKRLGLSLQEVKQLVDMYDSSGDTTQQLRAFLAVLNTHRQQLAQQLEDIEITLAEIAQHEERCKQLLGRALQTEGKPAVEQSTPKRAANRRVNA